MIGRPLHHTLRRTADKNTQRESSEGRTRTGDTRLMNQGPFPPENAFFAGNSAVSRHLSHNETVAHTRKKGKLSVDLKAKVCTKVCTKSLGRACRRKFWFRYICPGDAVQYETDLVNFEILGI